MTPLQEPNTREPVHLEEELRQDAARIVEVALQAVAPAPLVEAALESAGLPGTAPVTVLAVGKAALAMAWGAHSALGKRVADGLLIAPSPPQATPQMSAPPSVQATAQADPDGPSEVSAPPGLRVRYGGHPVPTAAGVAAAMEAAELLQSLRESDVLLVLLSGGASSLAALPADGISLQDYGRVTDLLLRAGAPIQEINVVRKHLDALKGGRAAALAAPARVLVLLLSDVVGNDPAVIASGPFTPNPGTYEAALHVLERRELLPEVPPAVREHLEAGVRGDREPTPPADHPAFQRVTTRIIGTNSLALHAAARKAASLGYAVRLLDTPLQGEARDAGSAFADLLCKCREQGGRHCVLRGGETTVTVTGSGRGGRNQEFALAAARRLAGIEGCLVAAIGTDGIDGPTDAAGAMVDGGTLERGRAAGVDLDAALEDNDAFGYFTAEGGLVKTGPTGGNVMDIVLGLVREGG